jgi:UPF0176 protein
MTDQSFVIAAFYQFRLIENYMQIKPQLLAFCKQQGLKGTLLIAREGINSTISGSRAAIDALFVYLREEWGITGLIIKESFAEFQPFERMKVRLKKEIVAMGVPDLDVDRFSGTYVAPKDWDALISDPDVIVVDTRNDYEVMIGTFDTALNPSTKRFREFPEWADTHLTDKSKKIAMFCTGGIRCEKSTSYLKAQGFENVYHLQGGILHYFEDTQNRSGKWKGGCFIFDERAVLDENLQPVSVLNNFEGPVTTDSIKEMAGSTKRHLKARDQEKKTMPPP